MTAVEPFSKFHLSNFNDVVKEEDLPDGHLRHVWRCSWTKETLTRALDKWSQHLSVDGVGDDTKIEEIDAADASAQLCAVLELALIFVQNNFTGPFAQQQEFSELLAATPALAAGACDPFVRLVENGEELNPNVKLGELLVVARDMLAQLRVQWPESVYLNWWHLRLLCLHQQTIDELTSNLYEQLKSTAAQLLGQLDALAGDKELEALLYLELANGFLLFHRTQKAQELLDALTARLNVTLSVEGLLGVRTKFQQKALPQLCLKVSQSDESAVLPAASVTNGSTTLPKLLLHEDDTRLERIRFVKPEDNDVMSLPCVLQALVLAQVKQLKRAQPKDRLADEELEPYTQTLLYQSAGPFQVRQSALLLNCVQEANARRTVERSWKQCEEAVKMLSDTERYPLAQRLSYAFAAHLQTRWQVQLQLCDLLRSLGMTKSALDIYLQLHAWSEVIDCYSRLELRHKAAEVIREQLAKRPTVLLYCLLGDATDDVTCYETAWTHSKQTSGKAQAYWGNYFFARKEYPAALEHLEQSVRINALQEKIWLRLGYAAMQLERWELAVHAYITYTHLEPLGFESWNNLAKALIQLGDKKRAHKVLGESLKCNYTNWKVWENYMLASVDTGHFEDALNAYNRMVELKDRYLDLEVLCITITAIAKNTPDAKGQSPARLRQKATKLLAHQCIKHGNEPKLWELAALLAPTPLNTAQKLMKALRGYTTKEPLWATLEASALKALQLARDLCAKSLEATTEHGKDESAAMITSQLSSARLAAQACVRSVEKVSEKWADNELLLAEVQQLLEQLAATLKARMGGS